MTAYEDVRDMLTTLQNSLRDAFEHGLYHCRQYPVLHDIQSQMAKFGLKEGADILRLFCMELNQLASNAQHTPDAIALYYAQLWVYLSHCMTKLDILEAEAHLIHPATRLLE